MPLPVRVASPARRIPSFSHSLVLAEKLTWDHYQIVKDRTLPAEPSIAQCAIKFPAGIVHSTDTSDSVKRFCESKKDSPPSVSVRQPSRRRNPSPISPGFAVHAVKSASSAAVPSVARFDAYSAFVTGHRRLHRRRTSAVPISTTRGWPTLLTVPVETSRYRPQRCFRRWAIGRKKRLLRDKIHFDENCDSR